MCGNEVVEGGDYLLTALEPGMKRDPAANDHWEKNELYKFCYFDRKSLVQFFLWFS
jgi:hypothetical protein